jgi:type IV fimbrial biogenesis protein FimT
MGRHGSAARGRRGVGGFTLVELLLAVAMMALLAMVAVPALGSLVERSRVAAATTAMAVSLANVRMRAVESATPYTLCPSATGQACDRGSDWSRGWIAYADLDRSGQREAPEVVADRIEAPAPDHVRVHSTQGRSRLVFQPDGSAGGSNVTFEFCARGTGVRAVRQIVVSNVGRARLVERPTVNRCNQ